MGVFDERLRGAPNSDGEMKEKKNPSSSTHSITDRMTSYREASSSISHHDLGTSIEPFREQSRIL